MELADRVGAHADVERFIPELYDVDAKHPDRLRRAIMDVVLQVPGRACAHWIDVSIRSAAAVRYPAARTAGAPSAAGERDKVDRYGGRVLPLIFEARGRLGRRSMESLQSIVSSCAAARLCNHLRPRLGGTGSKGQFCILSLILRSDPPEQLSWI